MRVLLLGSRIAYSASPAMQTAAFRAAGLPWTYELLDLPEERLAEAVEVLRGPDVVGANVTIPHKVSVMEFLDGVEPDAEEAGAVNTIRRDGGRLLGCNTDVKGIAAALREVGVDPAAGPSVLVLGCGGSARAADVALRGARVAFVGRHADPGAFEGRVTDWSDPAWLQQARAADLIVNCTPLGRQGELPISGQDLPRSGAVIDLVYAAGGTPLTRAAERAGLRVADGWTVLLEQGAESFRIWSGLEPPRDVMREALRA